MTNYASYNDEQLVNLLKDGDEAAFKIIYDKFYAATCYYASYFIDSKEEVKDIVTECFLKLWGRRNDFNNLATIKNFLEISVRNSCFNFIKHQKVIQKHQAELLKSVEENFEFANAGLDIHLLEAELINLIYSEIEQLSPQCKSIFTLAYLEDLKTNEIAGEAKKFLCKLFIIKKI